MQNTTQTEDVVEQSQQDSDRNVSESSERIHQSILTAKENDLQSSFQQLNNKIQYYSTMVDKKVQIIEDLCTQMYSIESQQEQYKSKVDSFLQLQMSEMNEIKSLCTGLVKSTRREVDSFRYNIKLKLQEYQQLKNQMDHMLSELKLLAVTSDGNTSVHHVEEDKKKDQTIQNLTSENEQLKQLVLEQKAMINDLFEERDQIKKESDQEIAKWKDISSLTLPLVQLLQHQEQSMLSAQTQNAITEESFMSEDEPNLPTTTVSLIQYTNEDANSSGRFSEFSNHLHLLRDTSDDLSPKSPTNRSDSTVLSTHSIVDYFNELGHAKSSGTSEPPHIEPFSGFQSIEERCIGCKECDHLDGFSKRACFNLPNAICSNRRGSAMYVAESGNRTIRKINTVDGLVSTITNGPIELLSCPSGICSNRDETLLFVADLLSDNVCHVDTKNGSITAAFKPILQKYNVKNPSDVLYDDERNILFISHSRGILGIELTKKNKIIQIGSTKRQGYKDGNFEQCLFRYPNGMTFLHDSNNMVVCDSGNHVLRIIDFKQQIVETYSGFAKPCIKDGMIFEACFSSPRKICFDKERNLLFVTESDNGHLRVVNMNQESVSTLMLSKALESPYGIAINDSTDTREFSLYVADPADHCIAHITMLVS